MKKHGKILRSLVSLTLVFSLCCSMFSLPAAAENNAADTQAVVDSGDLTVTSENSVGDLLANTINENQQDTSEACYVTDLEITGSTATVSFQTLVDSDIVVGIYTEDGKQLLVSGTAAVTSEENSVSVTLSGEMPEYFVASAYLLDAESHQPLSEEYTTQLYTYEMQQLISKTTADFDPDLVVNLDDDPNTNFAVFSEDTVMVEETAGANIVTDNGNGTYTITNADNSVTSLQPGDVFTCEQGKELLVIVVENVAVNGTTVTITEKADADIADAFEYVKIETISDSNLISVDNSSLDAGITYVGQQQNPYGASTMAVDVEQSQSVSFNYVLDKKYGGENANITLKGSIGVAINEKLNVYIALKYQYVKLKIDFSVPFNVSINGKLEAVNVELGNLIFSPIPGVFVEFTPSIVFEVSGSVKVGATLKTTLGLSYDSDNGFQNSSSSPQISDTELKLDVTFFIGLSLEPRIKILTDNFSVSATAQTGVEIKGYTVYPIAEDNKKIHSCKSCVDGDVSWKASVSVTAKFWKYEAKATLLDLSVKLFDFYYSLDNHEFGLGTCPHILVRVTVQALDRGGNPLSNTPIYGTSLSEDPVTDENGNVSFYLTPKYYYLSIRKGNESGQRSFWIDQPQKITIQLKDSISSGGNYGNGGDNIAISGQEDIIFDTEDQEGAGDEGTEPVEKVTWVLTNGKLIISGNGPMESCYQNSSDSPWYADRESVTSVYIESGVTTIAENAFSRCSNLTSVVIPNGVTSIGSYAFYECSSLVNMTIPEGVTIIGHWAFSGCSSLVDITIPDEVTIIGNFAFSGCSSLTSIAIPKGDTIIASNIFLGCTNLTSVVIPEGVTSISNYAFSRCSSLTSIVLPESITSIGGSAFEACSSLTSIIIPEGVTSIAYKTFQGCKSLTNIIIPEGVTSIGGYAFYGCRSLTSITIPEGVTSIGEATFGWCSSLTSVVIPEGVGLIGDYAFSRCSSLTSIMIPKKVTSIGRAAFSGCSSLTSIVIPKGVTAIKNNVFSGCSNLVDITIPEGVTSIGDNAFSECSSLVDITIPDGVTIIGNYAFTGCSSLKSMVLPTRLTGIPIRLFGYCDNLESVVIPKEVKAIAVQAFFSCNNLTDVYYAGSESDWNAITIHSDNKDLTSATIHYSSTGPTAEELAALMESANLNSIPDSDFDSDIQDGYLSEFDQQEEDFGLLEDQPDIDDPAFSEDEQLSHMSSMEQTFTEPPMDEGSSTLPFTIGSGQQIQSKFNNLMADEEYVLIVARDITADNLFAVDNLLYIAQGTADTGGSLSFEYYLPEDLDVSNIYARAFGKSNKDLANATVVVDPAVYDGMAQTPDPVVVYDGVVLLEGFDYTVSYSNNDKVGTGYVTVIGKIGYTGSKTIPFTITNGVSIVGDLNYDGSVDARDLVLLTRYVAGWNVSIREDLADVNGDDAVDGQDVIMLTRYLAGWGDAYKPVA